MNQPPSALTGAAVLVLALTSIAPAQRNLPPPGIANFSYGPHERNVLDLWKAPSPTATPAVVFIHGGGFIGGDKRNLSPLLLELLLKEGISVAAIHYRYTTTAPFPAPMHDAARAVQTLRHRAREWNLDPRAIGATGGSAGACISLWLGYHDDLADLRSPDPVARQSTRLQAMAVNGAQTSVDPRVIAKLISPVTALHPAGKYLYGLADSERDSPKADAVYKEASPITHLSSGDPPAYLYYGEPNIPVANDAKPGTGIHHPKFGFLLRDQCGPRGAECIVRTREDFNGQPGDQPTREMAAFFVKHLRRDARTSATSPAAPHGRNVLDLGRILFPSEGAELSFHSIQLRPLEK